MVECCVGVVLWVLGDVVGLYELVYDFGEVVGVVVGGVLKCVEVLRMNVDVGEVGLELGLDFVDVEVFE